MCMSIEEMQAVIWCLIGALGVIQNTLLVVTLVHVFKYPNYRFGNKVLWVILSFVNFVGPIIYFTLGKGKDE